MSRNKKFLMKEIQGDLASAMHVSSTPVEEMTFQEATTAGNAAMQAARNLWRLAGMLDVENDHIKQGTPK